MKITSRQGFTLVELIIATLIFGFMIMSLATMYSTANKHLFQSYRQDTIKSNASVAMKAITSRLAEANRIDFPAAGATGNSLRFAVNVDQTSGCYPINPAVTSTWHEFCYAPGITGTCPLGNCLFYYTGPIPGGGGCPDGAPWTPMYQSSVVGCGTQLPPPVTFTLLASFVQPPAGGFIFSRALGNGLNNTLVKISLRVKWDPVALAVPGKDFSSTAKTIDTTLTTTVGIERAGQ